MQQRNPRSTALRAQRYVRRGAPVTRRAAAQITHHPAHHRAPLRALEPALCARLSGFNAQAFSPRTACRGVLHLVGGVLFELEEFVDAGDAFESECSCWFKPETIYPTYKFSHDCGSENLVCSGGRSDTGGLGDG